MNFKKFTIGAFCLTMAFVFSSIAFAEYASKPLKLKESPSRKAKEICSIERGQKISILQSEGLWLEITDKKQTGWVRKLFVSKSEPGQNKTGGDLIAAVSLGTGRRGSGNIVSSTGVRGLDADSLLEAKFDDSQFKILLSYQTTAIEAKKFAKQKNIGDSHANK